MQSIVPLAQQPRAQGSWAGALDDIRGQVALSGWACALLPQNKQGPLRVRLQVEDLLNPGQSHCLAEILADQTRPDLKTQGLSIDCGFRLQTLPPISLPPRGTGTVLRAFACTPDGPVELLGSPLRLNAERYLLLEGLCQDHREPAGLDPLDGPFIQGWGRPEQTFTLLLDGEVLAQLTTGTDGRFHHPLPASACDGRAHHLSLLGADGVQRAEAIAFTPFQLTPWPALLEHGQPPFPQALAPLARERHHSLTTWLEWADADGTPLPADLPLLQRLLSGPLEVPALDRTLPLPTSTKPLVSVVVPVHNKIGITRRCLAALAYAPTRVPFELIVVDDGSSDGSSQALDAEFSGLTVMRHDEARGFSHACQSGVASARGTFVVLLNNDTEPCCRWLDELLEPFERWPDTGLVGAQLIYPDGSLQEAGGIVWGNGEPWNYGRGGNPYAPEVSYTRQVDYVSGAALAIRRDLWTRVGGFSPEFSPAYYEDTDLAFKVREAGAAVRYAPLSRVVHHEGLSCGTDPKAAEGLKRFQAIHAPLFQRKWQKVFVGCREPSIEAAELIKDRGILGRSLFLDHGTPRSDHDAGSHAALVEMDLMQALGWKITFLPANLAWLGRYTEDLQRRGFETIHAPFALSLEQFLQERGSSFDLIYLTRYTTVRDSLALIRRHAPQARLIFCNADLHHVRELRQVRAAGLSESETAAALAAVESTRQQEMAAIESVDLTLTYSEVEQAVIEAATLGGAATARCPWVVNCVERPAPLQERSGLAFLGSYQHPPNRDGIEAFLRQIWPTLLRDHPQLRLHLYGSGMGQDLIDTWSSVPGVKVHGWIADARQVYERHRVFIAPLRAGAGLKGKVVAALAHGIPQVLSPMAAEATGLRHGEEVFIASSPHQWRQAVGTLLNDDTVWQRCSKAALAHAHLHFSRARGLELMAEALSRLDLPLRSPC